jgi:MoaA/NifB/PqqE/SkfB family radical SAM enzyme
MANGWLTDLGKIASALAPRKRLGLVIFFVTSVCNAKCRTCFYWEELNQRGDLSWDEIKKLSKTMPRFEDFWLSGGEPMLRRELTDILHLFYVNNGIRWTNLPTNGLLPERTAQWTRRICKENPELHLDLNIAMDGLHEVQDSIRGVPGNFRKTLETLEAIQSCRRDFPNLRVNINTVICAENFESVRDISEYVKRHCPVDGHYFNIIRGNPLDPQLKRIPPDRLPELYRHAQEVYAHYAPARYKQFEGTKRSMVGAYYQGLIAFHNKVQLENIEASHPWPMPCTAGETSVVIDYNGDVRSCELRGKLANLRDFDCNFERFWQTRTRATEVEAIRRDQCWCTHVCFIHDSLRQSPRTLLYDIPVTCLETRFAARRARPPSNDLDLRSARRGFSPGGDSPR